MRKFSILLASIAFSFPGTVAAEDLPNVKSTDQAVSEIADRIHIDSRIIRAQSTQCRSEISNQTISFHNVGSMCADGFFALMEGRGCTNTVGKKDPTGRWTYHACETAATCDNLHSNTFAIVPVGISVKDNFQPDVEIWCADNSYIIIKM